MNRRKFFAALAVPLGAALILKANDVLAYDNPRRWVRPRLRVRRRIRRHVFIRSRFGRPFWVVPVGLAVGWELSHANQIVVVRETRFIEKDGVKTEVAIVQDGSGKTEQVEITREDSADNRRNLEGSVVDDGDTSTPAIEGGHFRWDQPEIVGERVVVVRLVAVTGAGATDHAAYEAAIQAAGHEQGQCVAQSRMAQSRTGSWAHAALGWLRDERTGRATFIELQHDNLERLQLELHAAALSRRHHSAVPLGALQARFASVPCRGQPVCALVLALRVD
jgi:hypothetical protein